MGSAVTPGADLLARFDELLGRMVSIRSRALVRSLVGLIAVAHLWPIARSAWRGDTFHGRFHQPYLDIVAELKAGPYTALITIGVVAAFGMCLGIATRWSTAITFVVVALHLLVSTTHVHNNRAYLVSVLALLAVTPTAGAYSIDAWWRDRGGRPPAPIESPAWTLWMLRFVCSTVYAASGISKLLDPDWFGGTVTWGRVVLQEATVRASVLPDIVVDVLVDRSFHSVAAKGIVLTELFIAGGLWWSRTRRWAIAAAVVFHVMIELSAEVQLFSWLALAVLIVWADPDLSNIAVRGRRRIGLDVPAPARNL